MRVVFTKRIINTVVLCCTKSLSSNTSRRLQHAVHQLSQRHHLFATNQTKFYRKIHKMFKYRVQMFLRLQRANNLEVRVVQMRVHSKQPRHDFLHPLLKIPRERVALLLREYLLVVDLLLHPSEQIPAIHRRRTLHRFHNFLPVHPSVLKLRPGAHRRTHLLRAVFRVDHVVEENQRVKKINHVHRDPFEFVFTFR